MGGLVTMREREEKKRLEVRKRSYEEVTEDSRRSNRRYGRKLT